MKLNHSIAIQRSTEGTVDERGVPAQTWATLSTVKASVQPKTVREMAQLSQAGPVAAEYTIYALGAPDIHESDRITEGTRLFEVIGVRDAAGAGHHVEVDAHLVTEAA